MTSRTEIVHGTTIAMHGKGVLIIGPSGAGKSALALALLTRGATLVADDRTLIIREDTRLSADVPEPIAGLIEARGVGLIKVATQAGPVLLHLVIDLGQAETARLPEPKHHELMACRLPCLHKSDSPHFADAIALYIKGNL